MSGRLGEMDEKVCWRIAQILGPNSAAAQALADLARRRTGGEDAALYLDRGTIIVGPRLEPAHDR